MTLRRGRPGDTLIAHYPEGGHDSSPAAKAAPLG